MYLYLWIFEIVVLNLSKRGLRVYCIITLQLLLTRVFSQKCNSFRKHFAFFPYRSLANNTKFRFYQFPKNWNFRKIRNAKMLRKKQMRNFAKKYGREIIYYDKIKLLILSSQSKEFYKFFCATNCCSYGFRGFFYR